MPLPNLSRRELLGLLGALGTAWPAHANTAWRLVVNEAVTGENNAFLLTARYRPLAEYLATHARVKDVAVEAVVDIRQFMALAAAPDKPELVFGKSVNQLAKLVRDHGYQPLVHRADPYKAAFIVPKNSPFKSLGEMGASTVVLPDEFAATTAVARAELRRQGARQAQIRHVKFQEVVAMEVRMGMAQAGAVNPTIARKWVEEGGRVLAETQPVVNWSLLAGPGVHAGTVEKLREALLAMNTHSAAMLGQLGVKSWAAAQRQEYLDLLAYTGE